MTRRSPGSPACSASHWSRTNIKPRRTKGGFWSRLLARASSREQAGFIGDQAGGRVFLFLRTDDFWRDYETMIEKGIRFVRAPAVEVYGTVAVFQDLYGNLWDLVQFSSGNGDGECASQEAS
jgi:hypothetical protein